MYKTELRISVFFYWSGSDFLFLFNQSPKKSYQQYILTENILSLVKIN